MTTNEVPSTDVPSVKIAKDGRKMNPNSLSNLKPPWQSGVSGNKGSGNGYSVTAEVKDILKQKPRRVAIAERMVSESEAGNVPMIRELLDRTEGKVPDKTLPSQNINILFVIGKGYSEAQLGISADPGS